VKIISAVGLLALALFFGAYAMILELRGMNNFDQILLATLFGILLFLRAAKG
jgi:hypothetical protein